MKIYIAPTTDTATANALAKSLTELTYQVLDGWLTQPPASDEGTKHKQASANVADLKVIDMVVEIAPLETPSTGVVQTFVATDPEAEPAAQEQAARFHAQHAHESGTAVGFALAKGKPVALIGSRYSRFHSLTNCFVFTDAESFLAWVQKTYRP